MASFCRRCSTEYAPGDDSCPACGASTDVGASQDAGGVRPSLAEDLLRRLRAATEDEFEVIQEIGHGGMARVYLAHEIVLERLVALKVLSPLFSEYPEIVRRFQHEARTAGQLSHPNIVPVFAVYQRHGLSFFSMPFVSGISLRALLRQHGPLEVEEAVGFVLQAAAGLAYAHDNGVVHRDVKPENMMLEEPHSRLVLTDFGLAKALGGESLTLPGDMIGTPHYMSPEQCEGRSEVDGRSDQYSLALVAYELLTGQHPFGEVGFRQLLMKQLHEDPAPLRELRPEIPDRVADAIHKALAKDLKDRFTTIYGFGEALAGAEYSTFVPTTTDRPRGPVAISRKSPDVKTIWMRERLRRAHRRRYSVLRAARNLRRYARRHGRALGTAAAALALVLAAAIGKGAASLDSDRPDGQPLSGDGVALLSFVDLEPDLSAERLQDAGPRPADPLPRDATEPDTAVSDAGPEGSKPVRQPTPSRSQRQSTPRRRNAENTARSSPGDESAGRPSGAVGEGARRGDDDGRGELTEGSHAGEPLESEDDAPAGTEDDSGAEALAALIEEYRRALEAEDLDALSARVYRGEIPGDDSKILRSIFDNADQLRVELDVPALEVEGGEARFEIEHRMRFLQAVTKREQTFKRELELRFRRDQDGWRLVALKT